MLSEQSAATVRATLPAVGASLGEITERFYDGLFTAHPELLRDLFNRGNQAAGTQRQALAASIAAFAAHLVEHPDERPDVMLSRIAHKHASLGVAPDQYAIVHQHLFAAVAEVLGDAITPEVAAAWDEVYWLMAYALINEERGLYSARGVTPEGVWRDWQVIQKIVETDDVVTFVVRRIDDRLVKTSLPGQYVTVLMPMPDGVRQPRQYSLTRADDGQHRQFSVKQVRADGDRPAGEVSTTLCRDVKVGEVLTMSLPYGDVVLFDNGRPVIFVSAGIGITPMAGMLSHLVTAHSGLNVLLLHADADERSFALRGQVIADIAALPNASCYVWYENGATSELPVAGVFHGMMDLSQSDLPKQAVYYLCGPLPFMQAVRSALIDRGVPVQDIQYEVFGPDLWQADTD
jgi:nitric oxide dioxygenase